MIVDVGGGPMHHNCSHVLSNISLRWMIRELVVAGYHDLFRTGTKSVQPRIHIPPATITVQSNHTDTLNDYAGTLDTDDLRQNMNINFDKWVPILLKRALSVVDHA
jgi:hypothetical protein